MALDQRDITERLERAFVREDFEQACGRRDVGAIIRILAKHGVTQGQIATLTGIAQGRLSEYKTGKRIPQAASTFEAIADGLNLPGGLRRALGLAQERDGDIAHAINARGTEIDTYDLQLLAEATGRRGEAIKRREMLDLMAKIGAAAAIAQNDTWQRLTFAMTKPSAIDDSILLEMKARSDGFHRLEQLIPAATLFKGLTAHLRELSNLINSIPVDPRNETRNQLIVMAGESSVLAGWIASDMGDSGTARHLYTVAESAAREANDMGIVACSYGYKSYMHATKGNHGRARVILKDALDLMPTSDSPGTTAWLAARHAEESAALGDRAQALRSWGQADEVFQMADTEEDRVWTRFIDRHRLDCFHVAILAGIGKLEEAQEVARQVMAQLPNSNRKRAVILLQDIASAHLAQGSINDAAELAKEGLAAMRETERGLWLPKFEALGLGLSRWRKQAQVQAYLEDLAMTRRQLAGSHH
ncbi:helix-turn-helix domain-containing protein [Nonomuraea sediminis]|uniref:helix-turn-helix domain-containing protein n=1 Tax=Nonomuraea sediminis TaxID=2835864 RepID=UPI001BDCDE7F|nr:helix-turn-helix transcriptional regulator [Nonomuraea sediminis]